MTIVTNEINLEFDEDFDPTEIQFEDVKEAVITDIANSCLQDTGFLFDVVLAYVEGFSEDEVRQMFIDAGLGEDY